MHSMTTTLAQKKCLPCEGGVTALARHEADHLASQVPEWKLSDDRVRISRIFLFSTFMNAIDFITKIAALAEQENHHPEIKISYRKVTVILTTHAVHGLSENDFVIAAKIDNLL